MSADVESQASNPLDLGPGAEERIRTRAYHLWEADGRPLGRDQDYWERARELEGIEASKGAGQIPVDSVTVVDEAALQDNLGEFPDRVADQGERRTAPMTRAEARSRARRT